ncbi:rod shape-determining protein MreC [Hymenobacter sp. BT559]|uniref:rod shape-determining protein MreC n=1 Tax=Hymenobacter sp. BT559 TaxID=2795729 RepID=UPI0018EC1390|nr:rod shape-determining protein MreC [Hymenobacter sp. BT559]MBJ6144945.1 rod shape-determining protein MreC [Hymenobacter sp. BT559]
MRNLIAFLLRYQGVMLFVLLEVVSLYFFLTNSSYQRAAFFNSANAYMGVLLARRTQVTDYFRLDELNKQLQADNAQLRRQLFPPDFAHREADSLPVGRDTLGRIVYRHLRPATPQVATAPGLLAQNAKLRAQGSLRPDTLLLGGSKQATQPLVPARVINNSLREVDNYLTLNVGSVDGVQPDRGVISAAGVVGKVQAVSAHYARVASVLHSKLQVAAQIKRDGTIGSVSWPEGTDYSHAMLDYIPRQNRLVKGDSVVTSGYNSVFPAGVFIGTVESFTTEPNKNFSTVTLRLGVDFSRLTYVYVVPTPPRAERDSLEQHTGELPAPVKAAQAQAAKAKKP